MENKKQFNGRLAFLIVLVLAVFVIFGLRLMQYQIVEAAEYKALAKGGYTSVQTIPAARGEILDRYGRPLAINQVSFDIIINEAYMPRNMINVAIERIIRLMESQGQVWIDNLPISRELPFAFLDSDEKNKAKIEKLKKENKITPDSSAQITLDNLFSKYKLDTVTDKVLARKIAGVRYEMEMAGSSKQIPYTFAKNIPKDTVVYIREYSQELPGIEISETTTRKYVDGDLAPHVVGVVGVINQEEYAANNEKIKADIKLQFPTLGEDSLREKYNEQRYGYNDVVGKSGLELTMEDYLRGENGKKEIVADSSGNVLSTTILKEAKPGNTLVLALDKDIQRAALEETKLWLEQSKTMFPPDKGGSANKASTVVINVKTGEVLAMVNYPTYDLSDYYTKYEELSTDPLRPLYNSAAMGTYMPGSIFKPVVAIGSLANGVITPQTEINCVQTFTRFQGYQPRCMGRHGHITVKDALKVSCNYFFYESGLSDGIDTIVDYANQFGLGVKTGIEIGENKGQVSSKEYFEETRKDRGEVWTEGNVLQAAIGQLDNTFTPLQMAVYTAALANDGKRMVPHLVKSIESYNFEETVKKTEPELAMQVRADKSAFDVVKSGMLAASRDLGNGTARAYFGDYPIDVAAKTGTPQATGGDDNATFIAYAPAGNPEIAVSVVVEKGYSGQRGAPIAKAIFNQYFGFNKTVEAKPASGQLLP